MAFPITLPNPEPRTRGTLLDAARQLDLPGLRWVQDGVTWNTADYGRATAEIVGCEVVYDKQPGDYTGIVDQPAFLLWRSLQCSVLSGINDILTQRVRLSLDELVSASLAAELETGAASGAAISLTGSTEYAPTIVEASAVPIAAAMVSLEHHLADKLNGAIGVIHLTPGLLSAAYAQGYVEIVGDQLRTATGHRVIGDAGHTGLPAPEGGNAGSATNRWVYATGPVFYELSPVDPVFEGIDGETFDFTRNVNRPLAERHGIVVLDPDAIGAVLVDVPASGGVV